MQLLIYDTLDAPDDELSPNPDYHGSRAAGILFFAGEHILLLLRSEECNEPWTYGIPGGKLHEGETAYEGALRESVEELGDVPPHTVFSKVTYRDGDFVYTTFLARVDPALARTWEPVLNWENDEARWFSVYDLPDNLHYGVEYLLEKRPGLFGRLV